MVDPVDDEDVEEIRVLRLLVLQRLTMRSKENGRILTLIRSIDHHFLLYTGLAIELIISDHRLPSFCQLDVQEAGKLTLKI